MCHGDDARDVNPVEINLVEEEELRHTAGCDARNPSPFGGREKTKAEKSNPKSGPQAANPVKSIEKLKSKLRRCTITGGGVSKVLRSQTLHRSVPTTNQYYGLQTICPGSGRRDGRRDIPRAIPGK